MQELHASLVIELPDDPRQQADILASFSALWARLLKDTDLEVEASLTLNESRGKPKRERTPKLKTVAAA